MQEIIQPIGHAVFSEKEISKIEHVPSKQHPDTLFSFMGKLTYLCDIIEYKMIPPRYCVEDISYLNIDGLERIAFPMRCFCDISLHKLSEHLGCYGQYGIAFTKVFGKDHGIQPLQYINEKSELRKDFTETFNTIFKSTCKDDDFKIAKNMLLHQLMFLKPYQGPFENRVTKTIEQRCFTDECEWRFVPKVSHLDLHQVIYEEKDLNASVLGLFNKVIMHESSVSINFEYEDIKHIIIATVDEFNEFVRCVENLDITPLEKQRLISKVIIWSESKGDF